MKNFVLALGILTLNHATAQVNLTNSLVACYALDGNANDVINSLNGTLSSVTPTVDRFNNPNSAYRFSGTPSSYIELPNDLLLKANAVSFSSWVKFDSLGINGMLFIHNGCLSYHEGIATGVTDIGGGNFRFEVATAYSVCSQAAQTILIGNFVPLINTWYHVGFYAGSDSLKIYVNGNLDAARSNPYPICYNPNANVYLGGTNLPFNFTLKGTMDNLRFYNRKLNGAEFNQLYLLDPRCIDLSTGINNVSPSEKNCSIYPNPGTGKIIIRRFSQKSCNIFVTNLLGKVISETNETSGIVELNLENYPGGVYFVQINEEGRVTSHKIIKE